VPSLTLRRNKQDLLTQLSELKTELASLRVAKITGGSSSKVNKMCVGLA
jgi:large subunit ribosomal protein L35e